MGRDDFTKKTVRLLADRAGQSCSNPSCRRPTIGPSLDPSSTIVTGKGSHITAAAAGGARYDPSLSPQERRSPDNGIWLCGDCAGLIDRDEIRFPVALMHDWKQQAEHSASLAQRSPSRYRAIVDAELRLHASVEERVALRALREELGCQLRTDVSVPTGEGWVNLEAAAVRGEALVAVVLYENTGKGIPYFQVEYVIELFSTVTLPRFDSVVLYVVVASTGSEESDDAIRERLQAMAAEVPFELLIRVYRVHPLRAKFGL